MRLIIGFLTGMIFMVAGAMLEGVSLDPMMQFNGCLIVFGGAFSGLLIAYPLNTIFKSTVLALTGREASRSSYLDAAKVFNTFGDLAVLSGIVGVILGTVHLLSNLEQPENIGVGAAVALCSLLYGVLAKFFIGKALYSSFISRAYPSQELIKNRKTGDDDYKSAA